MKIGYLDINKTNKQKTSKKKKLLATSSEPIVECWMWHEKKKWHPKFSAAAKTDIWPGLKYAIKSKLTCETLQSAAVIAASNVILTFITYWAIVDDKVGIKYYLYLVTSSSWSLNTWPHVIQRLSKAIKIKKNYTV